jgi:hypothetical protein
MNAKFDAKYFQEKAALLRAAGGWSAAKQSRPISAHRHG